MKQPKKYDRRFSLIILASTLGTTIEWYDFFLYGVLTPIVLNHVFFPNLSSTLGTIAAYTTFAVGFLSRPVGGIIFGHFGDRIGRKKILVLTLLIMGISTFLIGFLPGAGTIGAAAPLLLLLLRVLQGIGIGGEWGGAVLMAIEHAPPERKSFFGSWPQLGVPLGLMLSAGVVAILNRLPDTAFMLWGWRIAFLLSAVLVVVGVFVRLRILETPDFLRAQAEQQIVKVPVAEMLRSAPRSVLLTLGARYVEGACFNTFGVFIIAYVVNSLHLTRGFALLGVVLSSAFMLPFILLYGALADRIGLRRVFGAGALLIAIATAISFGLMETYGQSHPWIVLVATIVPFSFIYPMVYGPESSLFASQFDTRVRYTGVSFAYQASGIYASGLTPLIASALLSADGGAPWYVVIYMIIVSLISFGSVMAMRFEANPDSEPLGSGILDLGRAPVRDVD